MIKIYETTGFDHDNRPRNMCELVSDDQWFSMCRELGEINERNSELWSVKEVLDMVELKSLSGDYKYANFHDFENVLSVLDGIE